MTFASDFSSLGHVFVGMPFLVISGLAAAMLSLKSVFATSAARSRTWTVFAGLTVLAQYVVFCIVLGFDGWFAPGTTMENLVALEKYGFFFSIACFLSALLKFLSSGSNLVHSDNSIESNRDVDESSPSAVSEE